MEDKLDEAPEVPPADPGLVGNCFVCLPEMAVNIIGVVPNIDDKGDENKRLWLGRVWQLRALALKKYRRYISTQPSLSAEAKASLDKAMEDPKTRALMMKMQRIWRGAAVRRNCTLSVLELLGFHAASHTGTVLFMHGSGGMTYNNARYLRTLAGMGYVVIAPDSMAGGEYRRRAVAGLIRANAPTPYWDDLGLYTSEAVGEYAYSTKADAVVSNPEEHRKLYDNVYRMRRAEMHWILGHLPSYMCCRGVFTMGQSEGAMTVARFDDQRYGAMIRGRIISAFSVEYCYFTPSREAAQYGGSEDVPTLNIIGDCDQFFGPIDSVALSVNQQRDKGGWGADTFTGNGFKQMKRQHLRRGLVAVLEGARHDPSETHDNLLRDLLRAFLTSAGDCHRIHEQFKCCKYLSSKVTVVDTCSEHHGLRTLIKVGKMDFPSTVPHSRELLLRIVGTCLSDSRMARELTKHMKLAEDMEARSKRKAMDDLQVGQLRLTKVDS